MTEREKNMEKRHYITAAAALAVALTIAAAAVELRPVEKEAAATAETAEWVPASPADGVGREIPTLCEVPALITTDAGYTAYAFEVELMAEIVELEAGGESSECRRRVAEVILNRLSSGIWGDRLVDVLYATQGGWFEFESVYYLGTVTPSDETREIVWDVFRNGVEIPERVMFFRTGHYHAWAGAVDEFELDGVFFSSSVWCE